MKAKLFVAGLFGAALACALPAAAQSTAGDWALGVNLGTPGIGAELKYSVSPNLVVRGAIDGGGLSHKFTYDDIRYRGKLRMLTGGAFADLHPAGNPFFLTAGAYHGTRKIKLHAAPPATTTVRIGDIDYSGAQIGALDGQVKMSKTSPFVGLGFDNSFTRNSHWGFRAAAGVAISDNPGVVLNASGPAAGTAQFQTELARERANISDDAKGFKYFPVVQLGLSYRF